MTATTAEIMAYTYGGCGILAEALHDLTGWPIVAVADEECHCDDVDHTDPSACENALAHYLVEDPDGYLWDVAGRHDVATVVDYFTGCNGPSELYHDPDPAVIVAARSWPTVWGIDDDSTRELARRIVPAEFWRRAYRPARPGGTLVGVEQER